MTGVRGNVGYVDSIRSSQTTTPDVRVKVVKTRVVCI